MLHKTYLGRIQASWIDENNIFVFGSNTEGRHGAGAAKFALDYCGAIYGQSVGFQGNSYAIITKNLKATVHPSISEEEIINQIKILYEYALTPKYKSKNFIITYSGEGLNLNNYTSKQLAKMFAEAGPIPANMVFEEKFYELIRS